MTFEIKPDTMISTKATILEPSSYRNMSKTVNINGKELHISYSFTIDDNGDLQLQKQVIDEAFLTTVTSIIKVSDNKIILNSDNLFIKGDLKCGGDVISAMGDSVGENDKDVYEFLDL